MPASLIPISHVMNRHVIRHFLPPADLSPYKIQNLTVKFFSIDFQPFMTFNLNVNFIFIYIYDWNRTERKQVKKKKDLIAKFDKNSFVEPIPLKTVAHY